MRRMSTARILIWIAVMYGLMFTSYEKSVGVRTFLELTRPLLLDWIVGTLFAASVFFLVFVLFGEMIEPMLRPRCPRCGIRRFRITSVQPFGHRHYRCALCGYRLTRTFLGSWSSGPPLNIRTSIEHMADSPAIDPAPSPDWPLDPIAEGFSTDADATADWSGSSRVDLMDVLVQEGLVQPDHPAGSA